jgi:hypothetical protein
MLVFSSRVRLHTGEEQHLPLLDFHCPASDQNKDLAALAAELIDTGGGFLLQSGDSYHFYGKQLLDGRALVRFLARPGTAARAGHRSGLDRPSIDRGGLCATGLE